MVGVCIGANNEIVINSMTFQKTNGYSPVFCVRHDVLLFMTCFYGNNIFCFLDDEQWHMFDCIT